MAVLNIWSKPVISHEQRSWDEISSSPNVLGGETVEENNDASQEYESNPIEGKNKEERKEFTDNYLDKVFILRERATMDSLSESYKKGVKEILSKLNNLNNLSLNPDSNIEGLDKIFDELQDTLNESRSKVDQIKDSR